MKPFTHSGNTQFIMANAEQTREALRRARKWVGHSNQRAFNDGKHVAVSAVAEYILNEAGFTMYEMNAVYPKRDQS